MQNITRTLTDYQITAYDLVDGEDGMAIEVVGQCRVEAASMTKTLARAELAEAIGEPLKKGVTVKWVAIGNVTYAMPLDKFLSEATIVKKETFENIDN